MNSWTFCAAMSVRVTISSQLYRRSRRYPEDRMPSATELKQRIEQALPGAEVSVDDLTGGGDHFRAEVVSTASPASTASSSTS